MSAEEGGMSFEESLQPALDAYAAEMGRHYMTSYESEDGCACKCGWTPPAGVRRPRVSLGMHIKAAAKAADAAYDARVKELIRGRRR